MEHPSMGLPNDEDRAVGTWQRCHPDRRCGVCRLLSSQTRRERALFRMILTQDDDLLADLERLTALFYDAAAVSSAQADQAAAS